uniref:Uncharacterized protein n=1 Tax=Pseudodiaptomus poplesia TaxID=213370 RepID=A0A0U2MA78_9MAXI|nr:hypothetical protein [Pseudodiaptomus poplesia]
MNYNGLLSNEHVCCSWDFAWMLGRQLSWHLQDRLEGVGTIIQR